MCQACLNQNKTELLQISHAWIPYESASYLVVGWTCTGGGVLATAIDQLTAYRYARAYKHHGYRQVQVMPVSDQSFQQISYMTSRHLTSQP